MNKKTAWILAMLWMALIFYFSAQVASDSNEMSTGLTVFIRRIILQILPKNNLSIETLNHFLRKTAHYSIYLILGILLKNAFNYEDLSQLKSNLYPMILGIIYALSDEYHQSFVPNRGPKLSDVFIDSLGVITGIFILSVFIARKDKHLRGYIANIKDRLQL